MSRRRRRAIDQAVRSRVVRAKVLRRRGRGARRAAGAATAAAVSLAVAGGASAGVAPAERSAALETSLSQVVASGSQCLSRSTPPSSPSDLVDVDGTLFFTADDGIHGRELWKSSGSKRGTTLVKDINRQDAGEIYPEHLTAVGDTLFFTVDDGVHGRELWKSDGTKRGTALVRDIDPDDDDPYNPGPESLTAVGESLFFTADDGVHQRELWKSDGTRAGTVLVKDIDPGQNQYGPDSLTAVEDTLFLVADDGVVGQELWKSDGSKAGTVLVKDINPGQGDYGPNSSGPMSLTAVGDALFFLAVDASHGRELWNSDGTKAGTSLVKDIILEDRYAGGGYSPDLEQLTDVGGTLFFIEYIRHGNAPLWKSDGTEAGTVGVASFGDYAYPRQLTDVQGTLFFRVRDDEHGYEVWKSDGTEGGTVLVKDINADYGADSDPSSLTAVGGTLFFTADDGLRGSELWKSDGTEAGTVLVKDTDPNNGDGYNYGGPHTLTQAGRSLFFTTDDGVRGRELWKSDGTKAGTVLVKDINAGGAFTVAKKGMANFSSGRMRVKVKVPSAGRLVVGPVQGSRLKRSVKDVAEARTVTVTLRPTKAGLRALEKDGRLRVRARFTFTPCGGDATSVIRRYTLKMR